LSKADRYVGEKATFEDVALLGVAMLFFCRRAAFTRRV